MSCNSEHLIERRTQHILQERDNLHGHNETKMDNVTLKGESKFA